VFRDVGLTSATIYSDDITAAEVNSLFWINVGAGIMLAAILWLMAPLMAHFYKDLRLTGMLSVLAAAFVLNGIGAQYQALLQRDLRFKILTAIDVGANAVGTLCGLVAASMGWGYWSLVAMPVVTQAVNLFATIPVSRWHPSRPRWEARTAMMTKFGSKIAGFNILNYFARNLDNLLIGRVWGMDALGYYGRAYSLMMLPLSQIVYPLTQVAVPVLTRINGDRSLYLQTYMRMIQMIMLIATPLVVSVMIARVWVVEIVLGDRWAPVAPIFLALGFSALVQPMNNSAGWLMVSQGRSADVLRWGFIGGGLTVMSILAGLPFGPLYVAIGYSVGQILIVTPLLWWFACRNRFVRISDMASVAWPFWTTGAVSGLSFEAFRHWILTAYGVALTPFVGMALAFLWVCSLQLGLLALHSRSRQFLRTVLAQAKAMWASKPSKW